MYKGHKILCVIPVRGGSKGLPGKNIKKLNGKPLIAYTLDHARRSKLIDRTIVSTDSPEIAKVAKNFGAELPFIRPAYLAADKSSTIDVLVHAINFMQDELNYDFDIIVLLHATTPFRTSKDVDSSIKLLVDKKAQNVFSVADAHRNPYFNMVELDKKGYASLSKKGKFVTRQAAPLVYDMNSSIYVWWKDILLKNKKIFLRKSLVYVMPKERSVDIDDEYDFKVASAIAGDKQ
ncbi:MAG: hypothetical protein A2204_01145 [Elusimicrobia bacterium RIFOXYA1_FULL_47_7]|nr:MAG: hypothetical protein A2278_01830 [Elusimicrobia bacterium RIFOXYA12_FULL_49_49]OGS10208.1 MAG: hypothetical protein A2204_01145 [Elusimicrobia bacterium RIFOXYA1_FULL_47_7]OGS16788.1 MAG: hypothetical protein A2251_05280 [Elusimicrobia bacterium RIFOXYA2_FULL_47_53]OGS32016.1 MAG: hypothetical protein A2323_08055 [Elusimicrobia bacterium RIFOXYB2_FULL_46_23]